MKRLIVIGLMSVCAWTLTAQTTLDQCQGWTEENYPLVKNRDLVKKTTEFTVQNARHAWLPQIIFSAKATYQSDVTAFPDEISDIYKQMGIDIHSLPKDQYKIALDLQQTIWDGGVTKAQVEMAKTEGEVQLQQTTTDIYALKERVNSLFFGVLLLQEQTRQNEILKNLLQSNIDRVQGAIDGGVAMPCDRQMLEAELLQVQQNKSKIEGSMKAYIAMLELFTGHEIDSLAIPDEPAGAFVGENRRPELELIKYKQQNIAAQTRLANSAVMPRINLFAQGFYGQPGMNFFKDMTQDKWSLNGVVGVQLQWNIGGFYNLKGNKQKIALAQNRLDVQRDVFIYNIGLKNAEEENAIERMNNVMRQDQEIIYLRQTIREAYEAKLENGVANVNDLLGKISDENRAKIDGILHKIELLKYLYDIKLTNNN